MTGAAFVLFAAGIFSGVLLLISVIFMISAHRRKVDRSIMNEYGYEKLYDMKTSIGKLIGEYSPGNMAIGEMFKLRDIIFKAMLESYKKGIARGRLR